MTRRDIAGVAAVILLSSPLLVGGGYSVLAALGLAGVGATGFTFDRVIAVLTSPDTWRALLWTILTAGVATAAAAAAAILVAIRLRHSRIGRMLAVLPMGVPHVAAALSALLMFGQSGLLARLTTAVGLTAMPADFPALVYDQAGASLIVAFAWKEFPYLALSAMAVLLTDTANLEEIGRTLGATRRQVFWRITWPRLWRGTSPAVLAAFAFLVGQYEMPALLAPSDPLALPLLIYERTVEPNLVRRGEAHVLALLALAVAIAIVIAHATSRTRTAVESR